MICIFFWTLGYSPGTAAQGRGGLSGQSTNLLTVVIFRASGAMGILQTMPSEITETRARACNTATGGHKGTEPLQPAHAVVCRIHSFCVSNINDYTETRRLKNIGLLQALYPGRRMPPGHPETNQGPSDSCKGLTSDALPTEL